MIKRYALVTGGSKNIGAAICERLNADGFSVIIIDIIKPAHNFFLAYYQLDLSNIEQSNKTLSQVVRKFDVNHLVNNVGVVSPASAEETSTNTFNEVMGTNTLSALITTQAVLPIMKAQKFGRIVSIASRVVLGKKFRTSYSASKGALLAMTRTWALELAEYGITVNCVAPGPIATSAFWENNPPDSNHTKSIIESVPIKRLGSAEDVAHAVSYFLDERSSFVTGQILYVCGGLTVGFSGV